jgi:3-isopropylmalate/(R)-2-methylmalate dehydratase large subunit
MDMTLTEKIMARASGRTSVRPGEIVYPEADLATIHDLYVVEADTQLRALGVERPWNPDRVFVCFDHDIIPQSIATANRAKNIREIVRRWGVKNFYGPGRGQGHVFPMEIGLVRPGMCVQAYDIHVTNYGAVGCLGISLVFEFPAVLATGNHWYRVPETIRIELDGKFSPGVTMRDLAALIIREIGPDQADYRVFEYTGPALAHLGVDARVKLCNLPIEIGAKTAIVPADELVSEWFKERNLDPFDPIESDPDAEFFAVHRFDLSAVEPMVALPPLPDNVVPLREAEGVPVHAAYLGSCAGNQYEDMAEAAAVLRGRKVAPGVRMIINPGSKEVTERCVREGIMEVFLEAGACVGPPGCGPCAIGRGGPLADGETCIATVTRNDTGRMGSRKAEIYLSSAATVAASAVAGQITDPREYLNERDQK